MAVRKSLETISGIILNQLQPKFAVKTVTVANEKWCFSTLVDKIQTSTSFIVQFRDFLSNLRHRIIIYCVTESKPLTNHPYLYLNNLSYISSAQFSATFHVSEVDDLPNEHWHWAKIVQRENILTPFYVQITVQCDIRCMSKVWDL